MTSLKDKVGIFRKERPVERARVNDLKTIYEKLSKIHEGKKIILEYAEKLSERMGFVPINVYFLNSSKTDYLLVEGRDLSSADTAYAVIKGNEMSVIDKDHGQVVTHEEDRIKIKVPQTTNNYFSKRIPLQTNLPYIYTAPEPMQYRSSDYFSDLGNIFPDSHFHQTNRADKPLFIFNMTRVNSTVAEIEDIMGRRISDMDPYEQRVLIDNIDQAAKILQNASAVSSNKS